MARIDQLSDDSGTYKACGTCDENTHIFFLLSTCDLVDRDGAFTRVASRAETLRVICLHSRFEAGRPSIATNSCNQSSAESSACSDPNNSFTARMNAANSCSAILISSEQLKL